MSSSGPVSNETKHRDKVDVLDEVDDELLDDDGVIERRSHPLSYMTKSVANLCTGLNLSEATSPLSLSRSESISSLTSSCTASSAAITAQEIRSLTNNYQRMLKQATKEIKKLNVEKWKLEQEQDKLLNTNLELADQVRKMMLSERELRNEKKELLAVNEEFATEVEKLYKLEEKYISEKENLESQIQELQIKYQSEKNSQSSNLQDEKFKLESQVKKLTHSLETLKLDYEQLLENNKRKEKQLSTKQEDILLNQEKDIGRLQRNLKLTQSELEEERRLREAAENQARMMSHELRRNEEEMKKMTKDSSVDESLKIKNEKLGAENFEYAVENNELKKKIKEFQEREKILKKELNEVRKDNSKLIHNSEKAGPPLHEFDKQLDIARSELKDEKEKVKNLTVWKSQLSDKNKELKDENEKLLNKVEDLERLMNDEVTDINEILNVINTIQVDKQVPELKGKGQRFL